MARICQLLSLALSSLFLTVSGHVTPAKTVSELQTKPFTEIMDYLNQKEQFAPKTTEFKAMFTMCKEYVTYLKSLYKYENPIVDVLGIAKIRYALMNKAIIAVQAKVNKENSLKVSADLAKGFLQVKDTIVEISAKHHFQANAKINTQESETIEKAMTNLRVVIDHFLDAAKNHGRELTEAQTGVNVGIKLGGVVKGSLADDLLKKNSVGFGGKALFDAAGKMKIAGKDGFRSLNREHIKHLVSKEA